MEKAKKWIVPAWVICLVAAVVFLWISQDRSELTRSREQRNLNHITNVFWDDGNLYYITYGGMLYENNTAGEELVHTFPTGFVQFVETEDACFYLDPEDKTICKYVLAMGVTEALQGVRFDPDNYHADYVFWANGSFCCYRLDGRNHMLNLMEGTVSELPRSAHVIITAGTQSFLYQSEDYRNIYLFDPDTNTETLLASENTTKPIRCACVAASTLYYARSERELSSVTLHSGGAVQTDILPVAGSLVALGENQGTLFLALAAQHDDADTITVTTLDSDREPAVFSGIDMDAFEVAGGNMLQCSGREFAFASVRDNAVIRGILP